MNADLHDLIKAFHEAEKWLIKTREMIDRMTLHDRENPKQDGDK